MLVIAPYEKVRHCQCKNCDIKYYERLVTDRRVSKTHIIGHVNSIQQLKDTYGLRPRRPCR